MTRSKRIFSVVVLLLFSVLVFTAVAWILGYRINVTASYPRGVWKLTEGTIGKGALVMFCPPDTKVFRTAKTAGYLYPGSCPGGYAPLIKRIVAVPGDRVDVGRTVRVDGIELEKSELFERDSAGRLLPQLAVSGIVPEGQVWLMSDYACRSFDSRYFGALDASQIVSVIKPVWTWEGGL